MRVIMRRVSYATIPTMPVRAHGRIATSVAKVAGGQDRSKFGLLAPIQVGSLAGKMTGALLVLAAATLASTASFT